MLPARRLAMQQTRALHMRPTRFLQMQPSLWRMRPVPKEEHSAHTVTQRLRTLRKIPAELIPLGIVMAVAIGAAVYSCVRKLMTDKQLRLYRTPRPEN